MPSNNTNSSLGPDERDASSSAAAATSSSSESSWQSLRIIGRQHYDNGEYDAAFYAFRHAYTKMKQQQQQSLGRISNEELQFMLSNVIACRLQIGGLIHLQTAIEESKECIAINPTWSKAYIRLASSYMALRTYDSQRRGASNENHTTVNNYSNDICNALQTAIRYDTNHTTAAKQMLLQELRLRNQHQNGPMDQNNSTIRSGTNPPPMNPSYVPPTNSVHGNNIEATIDASTNRYNAPTPLEGFRDHESDNYGDATFRGQPSDWSEYGTRLFQSTRNNINALLQQLQVWYQSLPNNQRQVLACLLVLLLLLVVFSLDPSYATGGPRKMKGNYGSNNIYEQIQQEKLQQHRRQYYNSQPHHHVPPDHEQRHPPPYESYHHQDHYARTTTRASRSSSSSSFEVNGILYVALIAGAVYIGHTYFGINPWQMIMLLRMANGGGGGFMRYGGAGGRGYRRRGYW